MCLQVDNAAPVEPMLLRAARVSMAGLLAGALMLAGPASLPDTVSMQSWPKLHLTSHRC